MMDEKKLELFTKLVENTDLLVIKMMDISDSIDGLGDSIDNLGKFLEAIAHNVGR